MASSKMMICVAMLLVLVPIMTKGDDISPTLAPLYDELCKQVECGKGTCKGGLEYKFNYKCDCEDGWRRTRLDDDNEDNHQYLPCIIPNCTLNDACMPAPPPVPENPRNTSFFDPCYWMYCGQGTCSKSSDYKFECKCQTGYNNLLNNTYFPCYSDCALTSDCERLGIKVSNATSSNNTDQNQGSTFQPGKLHIAGIMGISMVLALLK